MDMRFVTLNTTHSWVMLDPRRVLYAHSGDRMHGPRVVLETLGSTVTVSLDASQVSQLLAYLAEFHYQHTPNSVPE